jgi:hypothetical protein
VGRGNRRRGRAAGRALPVRIDVAVFELVVEADVMNLLEDVSEHLHPAARTPGT